MIGTLQTNTLPLRPPLTMAPRISKLGFSVCFSRKLKRLFDFPTTKRSLFLRRLSSRLQVSSLRETES